MILPLGLEISDGTADGVCCSVDALESLPFGPSHPERLQVRRTKQQRTKALQMQEPRCVHKHTFASFLKLKLDRNVGGYTGPIVIRTGAGPYNVLIVLSLSANLIAFRARAPESGP